jgi:uncharacterized protein YbbC (DUF1343 family)
LQVHWKNSLAGWSTVFGIAVLTSSALILSLRKPKNPVQEAVLTPVRPLLGERAVRTGLEILIKSDFEPLRGKRVGLITNPTGVDSKLRATIDILHRAQNLKLVALYGPEHGVRGDAAAGASVANAKDPTTGLPAFSLYGKTRKPTAEMLRGVDVLVFDIQDIGARSYTYISTLGLCMEAAAENGIPFVVLDRPNPCGGDRVEGNIPAPAFRSFVSKYPIPYTHGLTVGELAQMIAGEGWLPGGKTCDLTVVPMEGWRRTMTWDETRLPWVPTSPHIPHPNTSLYYVATGIVGEQPTLNIGVGYTLPFELAGAPGLSAQRFAEELNRRKLNGVFFRPIFFKPFYAAYQGQVCGGVQIYFTDPRVAPLARINFELMDAARRLNPKLQFFPPGRAEMFDKICGTDQVRKMFQAGKSASEIWSAWNADSERFREKRKPYLLYR